jgi:hypothetical protein
LFRNSRVREDRHRARHGLQQCNCRITERHDHVWRERDEFPNNGPHLVHRASVSPDQYAQAAQEALSKLSPEERAAFVKMLQDRAAARGVTLPRQVAPEPKDLGQVLTGLHAKPGQLRDMLGGGAAQPQEQASGSSPITDILTSPMAKAVLAGIAAMVVKRVMSRPSQTA